MKLVNQKRLYGALIVFFLTIVVTAVYYALGGFEEVKVHKLAPETKLIAGKYFYTKYSDSAPQDHFDQCAALVLDGSIKGVITTVDYLPDTLDEKMRMQFIGITLEKRMAELPASFEVREYVSKERYVVFLSMNPMVRPPIPRVENMLRDMAQKDGFDLQDFFIRMRYPDNSVQVEAWVE
ncbi:MAG: hypothetical protein RIA69_20495 [Cyclobacteriaceae bacterium]